MEDLKSQLIVLVGGVLLWLFDKWWKRYTTAREKAEKVIVSSVETFSEVNRLVKHEERKMMIACNRIMRIHVMHFSNGTETDAGLHLLKLTFVHEIVQNWSVEPIAQNFQELPIPDMFLRPVSAVIRTGQYYLKRRSDLDPTEVNDSSLATWLGAYNPEIKSMLWIPINSKFGKPVAILCMYFPAEEAVDDKIIIRLKDMNHEIEKIYQEKFKKNGK
jgi:hypothetical protein